MSNTRLRALDRLAIGLSPVSLEDRMLKRGLVAHFISHRQSAETVFYPSISLLQPVTCGVSGLCAYLEARARFNCLVRVQHGLLCDGADSASQNICREMIAAHLELPMCLVYVEGNDNGGEGPAPKAESCGLPRDTGHHARPKYSERRGACHSNLDSSYARYRIRVAPSAENAASPRHASRTIRRHRGAGPSCCTQCWSHPSIRRRRS